VQVIAPYLLNPTAFGGEESLKILKGSFGLCPQDDGKTCPLLALI